LPPDPNPALQSYTHPERSVTADWSVGNIGRPGLSIVESDEAVRSTTPATSPVAVKIDWHTGLNDPHVRDYINGAQFAKLMDRKGISRGDTVVVYGDKSNWWAAHALCFHAVRPPRRPAARRRARSVVTDGRDTTLDVQTKQTTGYPVVEPASARTIGHQ
jgi:thiosulfate/3-mercaptopyruvate sulfurtransferase